MVDCGQWRWIDRLLTQGASPVTDRKRVEGETSESDRVLQKAAELCAFTTRARIFQQNRFMSPPFPIDPDVRTWIRRTLQIANVAVSRTLDLNPNTYEVTLDQVLIASLSASPTPVRFPSGQIVKLSVHFLGGGRHFGNWEVADLGVLLQFVANGRVVRTKVALLQSKRLYPTEVTAGTELGFTDYAIGMGRLVESEGNIFDSMRDRTFTFAPRSRYEQLVVGDNQWSAIQGYQTERGIPIYYNLYHPSSIPWSRSLPQAAGPVAVPASVQVGSRVVPAGAVAVWSAANPRLHIPSFSDLKTLSHPGLPSDGSGPGWRLEGFVADELVECHEGYLASSPDDAGLMAVLRGRNAPISAAISITVASSDGYEYGG